MKIWKRMFESSWFILFVSTDLSIILIMPTSQVTIYSRWLRSAQKKQVCRCKVGSCPICGSKCRRCMCACDGVEPAEALSRSRGGYRRQANAIKQAAKAKKSIFNGRHYRSQVKQSYKQPHGSKFPRNSSNCCIFLRHRH